MMPHRSNYALLLRCIRVLAVHFSHRQMEMTMKTIAAGEFKSHCLRIVDEVNKRLQPVLITKKGVAVAKLVPVDVIASNVMGCLAGSVEIVSDIEKSMISLDD